MYLLLRFALMKIILADTTEPDPRKSERSFEKPTVSIGRNADECDVAFEKARFPMVSRRHAELRWQNGAWFIVDQNSSYGTFLNGGQVLQPMPVPVGSKLQFGPEGPVLIVVWFDVAAETADPARPAASQQQVASATPTTPKPSQPLVAIPEAQLEFVGVTGRVPFKITKPSVWLGRDPGCDIVFEASAGTVSRRHAEIAFESDDFLIKDNKSFNGTLVNGQRISADVPIYDKDEIQLGLGGPVVRFHARGRAAPAGSSLTGQRSMAPQPIALPADTSKTMVANFGRQTRPEPASGEPQLLFSIAFGPKTELTVGRSERCDIRLDGLQVSNQHARLRASGGEVVVEDLNSTNGTFVNGLRVSRQVVRPTDVVQIGAFVIRVDQAANIGVFDTRSKTRIDVVNVSREVSGRFGGARIKLLDSISLSIQPNEFVGLLGPSGAGKSSLIEAMNGVRPPRVGNVYISGLDIGRHFDSLKQAIGYVPQEDVIHRELSVYRTLYYVAKLRLSRDASPREIDQIVGEVMDITGLTERRNVPVEKLSGGQRKRISIAVELLTKPSVIFLDEPTAGLDPATADRIMRLFRTIAESGRTVVMTTHAMDNLRLFDKIIILMRGRLVFYGKPEDALRHLGAKDFKELYDKLEEPVADQIKQHGEANRANIEEHVAENWKQKYLQTAEYKELVLDPLRQNAQQPQQGVGKRRRLGLFGSVRQWFTLSRRYLEVLSKDKLNLLILFVQAPVIALLTFFVMGADQTRDFVYFVVALVAIWFGTSVAAREIVREWPVYRRERMFNLGIIPYLFSKLFVLGIIVFVQCVFLFVPLKFFHLVGLMPMPGDLAGIPQFWTMLLTAAVGIATGLLVSSVVRTSQMATSLVPLILIPQILFSGLVGVPHGVSRILSMTVPAAYSFDAMKRFSGLETLEPEGATQRTKNLGLYKYVETENEKVLDKARKDLEDFKQISGGQFQAAPGESTMADRLAVPAMKTLPDDLSTYVTFLHPWMNEVVSQFVLMLMFWMLAVSTLIALRLRDIR